jgi:hypothetical protein
MGMTLPTDNGFPAESEKDSDQEGKEDERDCDANRDFGAE